MFSNVAPNKSRDQRLTEIQQIQQRILDQTAATETAKSTIKAHKASTIHSVSMNSTLDEV